MTTNVQTTPEEFYSLPWVAQAIVDQARHRYMTVRFDWGMCRHLARHDLKEAKLAISNGTVPWVPLDENPFIEIHSVTGEGPYSLDYWVRRGAIEFIPEVSDVHDLNRTDVVIVDLDPKDEKFQWQDLVDATKKVMMALLGTIQPEGVDFLRQTGTVPFSRVGADTGVTVRDCKLRFSGSRSFHIYIQLEKRAEFPAIRTALKAILDPLEKETNGNLTYHNLRDRKDFILVDIGAVARHRCVRSLYSMHAKTGRICIPVKQLDGFEKESAAAPAVTQRGRETERF